MIVRGIIQFHVPGPRWRERIKGFADVLARTRVSARGTFGEPLIAVLISPQDRDELVELMRKMAETTEV